MQLVRSQVDFKHAQADDIGIAWFHGPYNA